MSTTVAVPLMPSYSYQFTESQLWNVFLVFLFAVGLLAWASCVFDLLRAKEHRDAVLVEGEAAGVRLPAMQVLNLSKEK